MNGNAPRQGDRPQGRQVSGPVIGGLLILILLAFVFGPVLFGEGREGEEIPYRPTFVEEVEAGNVTRVTLTGDEVEGEFAEPVDVPAGEGGGEADGERTEVNEFYTAIPQFAERGEVSDLLADNDVVVDVEPVSEDGGPDLLLILLLSFLPILLIIGFLAYAARQGGPGGGIGQFFQSRARRVSSSMEDVSFDDVAGIDEARAELEELVDFLREPRRYQALGGRVPRGILLTGAPGTGKTLLARAVAGESRAPFFSIAASEFVEALVGAGAARVRSMFEQAKREEAAIVFIDELDAVGRRRGGVGGATGANDEREQTLNQILAEMDGFESDDRVIVMAATNRPEDLDKALLRPGRFDRRVTVQMPDRDGRRKIFAVHTRSLALGEDVDLGRLAKSTPGMSGADIANLCNEAALGAGRRRSEWVEMQDFLAALERVALGRPRGIVLTEEDRRLTAYHEAGHALVAMLTEEADPVRKVSIVPRGQTMGATLAAPDVDRHIYRRRYLWARMRVALGGRAAEELACDDVSTGAEDDLEQITQITRRMVGRWGMSDSLGPVSLMPRGPLAPTELSGGEAPSDFTQRMMEEEVQRIVGQLHEEVQGLLAEDRERLDALAEALLEHESLDEDAAYRIAGIEREAVAG